jgi:hypothetical protein
MNQMSVMSQEGDTKIFWDPTNPESVEVATTAFNSYRSQGYQAFAMTSGTSGEQMTGFDPAIGSIVFVPQMQGG